MFKWRSLVKTVAPTLATALGGPLAGNAVRMIAEALLGNPDATESEIEEALERATPEDLAKLKKIETDFKIKLKELDIKKESLTYEDTADAREMAERTSILPQLIVIGVYNIGFFVVLAWLIAQLYNETGSQINPAILSLVSGTLGVLLGEIPRQLGFLFGSSSGSKTKTAALTQAMTSAVQQAQEQSSRAAQAQTAKSTSQKPSPDQLPESQPPAPVSDLRPPSTQKPSWMD